MRKITATVVAALLTGAVLTAAPAGAGDPTPRPWRAKPEISEQDGSSGWGWYVAWTANSTSQPRHFDAFFRETDSGITSRVNGRRNQAAIGGFASGWLVFNQWRAGQPGDIFMIGQDGVPWVKFPAAVNTSAKEFLPTLWGDWLLFTRHDASTDTHRVMLYNRATEELRTLDQASGDATVLSGQVRGDYATWYSWGPERSNVFVYQISTQTKHMIPRPRRISRQYRPTVAADGTVYYQRRKGRGCGGSPQLMMYHIGGPPTVLWKYPKGTDGGRLLLDPPGTWSSSLNITVITCRRPSTKATDIYRLRAPSNPFPQRQVDR